jgi:alpha-mannosidase
LDAPLVEVGAITANKLNSQTNPDVWIRNLPPSQTFYSWVMNNHWGTNYRAFQEGPVTFRYAVRPYRATEPGAQQRFGQEQLRPLLVSGGKPIAPLGEALLRVQPAHVMVESLAPSRDGKAWMLRLFNASPEPVHARLNWRSDAAPGAAYLSNLGEDAVASVGESISMPAWGVLSMRVPLR